MYPFNWTLLYLFYSTDFWTQMNLQPLATIYQVGYTNVLPTLEFNWAHRCASASLVRDRLATRGGLAGNCWRCFRRTPAPHVQKDGPGGRRSRWRPRARERPPDIRSSLVSGLLRAARGSTVLTHQTGWVNMHETPAKRFCWYMQCPCLTCLTR